MIGPDGITESTLLSLRSMPDEIAAVALDGELRKLEAQWRRSFVQRGLILLEMEQRLLWAKLEDPATGQPYRSMGTWICDAAPQSRSDCYAALAAVKALHDVPREQLAEIPRCNISILQALSSKVRQNESVMTAARTRSQKDFVAMLEKDWPEQHVESRRMIHLNPVKSASIVIDQAMELCMELEGLTTREQVLEFWSASYLADHLEVEDGQENRESCG